MSCTFPPPDALAEARATVLDPSRVNLHPALMAEAWSRLKQARGVNVRLHLLEPAHIIREEGTVALIDACRGRVSAHIRKMFGPPDTNHGGDAA